MAISKEILQAVNEYARLAKTRPLTPEELADQKKVRAEYLKQFRANFKSVLDNVEVVDKIELPRANAELVREKLSSQAGIVDITHENDVVTVTYAVAKINEQAIVKLLSE